MTNSPPDHILKRLRRAEARQRRETLARSLFAEPVDVLVIWIAQAGRCGCGCNEPFDIERPWDAKHPPRGYPVIAHALARGSKGEHSRDNVQLWRHACNREAGHRETSEAASVKRFTVVKGRKPKGSISSRGFDRRPRKYKWPSRPLRSKR